jgi:hypothetical protein
MRKLIKVICIERCNSYSYNDPEWIIYDRGEEFEFYDAGHEYQDSKCLNHFVNKKYFITLAEWRAKQIDSILEDD